MITGKLEESVALLPDSYEDLKDGEAVSRPHPEQRANSGLRWMNLLLCLFVFADLAIFLFFFRDSAGSALGQLEFRDTYIGLKALYGSGRAKASPRKPIVGSPRVQTQVSSAEPAKLAPADYHQWLDGFGMLSSRDRHLFVSSDVHTILQFRAMDFGMEKCALGLRLPPLSADKSDPHAFKLADNRSEMRLDVCKSDLSMPLAVQSLSFSNRPACQEHEHRRPCWRSSPALGRRITRTRCRVRRSRRIACSICGRTRTRLGVLYCTNTKPSDRYSACISLLSLWPIQC